MIWVLLTRAGSAQFVRLLFLSFYAVISLLIFPFGIEAVVLMLLRWRHRHERDTAPSLPASWPKVVVQLPVYNERHVINRLLASVAALDYPADRLEIQVLDDSTDDTTQLAEVWAAHYRGLGLQMTVLHRTARTGYKAGALASGLAQTQAEFVAIFDADYCPGPDFLRKTVPFMLADPGLGFVQAAWGNFNERYSAFTRALSIWLDGLLGIWQIARSQGGLVFSFNGTVGMWRRACIEDAGGWSPDTLAEDLDLSIRAQLGGWRGRFLPYIGAMGELPPQLVAFKRQQARWATGGLQCLRKLAGPILHSRLPAFRKALALICISAPLAAPFSLVLLLGQLPLVLNGWQLPPAFMMLTAPGLAYVLFFAAGTVVSHRDWVQRLPYLGLLILILTSISWEVSVGLWRGLRGWGGQWQRTPKFNLVASRDSWRDSPYRLTWASAHTGEILLTTYAGLIIVLAARRQEFGLILFPTLFAASNLLAIGAQLFQGRARKEQAAHADLEPRPE